MGHEGLTVNAIIEHTQTTPVAQLPVTAETSFQLAQRQAKALSSADLVPAQYRGNVPNTLIAMEVANRIGASPFLVMQNLYIVHGRPSWSSQFLIATVNACGRFTPMRYEISGGDDPHAKDYRVRAIAKDKASGEECIGPWITWKMVDAEGWSGKSGSKWKSIPDLMFRYRAATFWTRLFAPELSMGIHTAEELQDVWGGAQSPPAATDHADLTRLEAELIGKPADPLPATSDNPDFPLPED